MLSMREYLTEQFGSDFIYLENEGDGYRYLDLVENTTLSRPALMRGLLKLGVSGPVARWHLAHRGEALPFLGGF